MKLYSSFLFSFLDFAADNDFVMSSILAFSATDLAWTTKSGETGGLALQHRGTALQGLQPAIGDFSRETSDPTLAATLLLLWQASDWYVFSSSAFPECLLTT